MLIRSKFTSCDSNTLDELFMVHYDVPANIKTMLCINSMYFSCTRRVLLYYSLLENYCLFMITIVIRYWLLI